MKFYGRIQLRIGEAVDLKPTTFSRRHSKIFMKNASTNMDPYIVLKVDDVKVGQTHTKQKTNSPTYNEDFSFSVQDGQHVELAVFHETPIGYDYFVANCTIRFVDLITKANTDQFDEGWVSKRKRGSQLGGGHLQ